MKRIAVLAFVTMLVLVPAGAALAANLVGTNGRRST